ncbi:TlpA family protein disulfide reductase [Qipengyuania sp.]|uniref:TlpA family protein disulfide reductase n=1 Tax=Qipengyuania sp. TaxID=2004515 RepID=UPI0035C7A893
MPTLDLVDPEGKAFNPADIENRPVLLNLWATWCAPCVKEMPLLDDLVLEEPKLTVLTASQDMGPPADVQKFFEKEGLERLKPWIDREGALGLAFGGGLPVTILYDSDGKEVWRVVGDLDWGAPDVRGALDEAIDPA